MVGVKNNRQTLAFISAIDFLTGDILISGYVAPSEVVLDWRSEITGITETVMESAKISGAAFKDWREARENLWRFADSSTVFVGQSLNYDLGVLGISHPKIVDSAILTAEAVFPSVHPSRRFPRAWSLKVLAKAFLALEIQKDDQAHSALEDAYTTRYVIILCIRNPEALKSWAQLQRDEEERKRNERRQKKKGKKTSNIKNSTGNSQHRAGNYSQDFNFHTDEDENFRLSDYAREFGWPDGWDPWSD
ncbi:ribonuclease H-like protein [Penicillium herquei]|nr:ribonuclease H-like protein [Penicillium herquei]